MIDFNSFFAKPKIMAIVNCTPDSFLKESRVNTTNVLDLCQKKIDEGADLLDLGAYSTRPGALEVSIEEEIDRLLPMLSKIAQTFPQIPISVDTFRKKVAEEATNAGACLVNDVSGGQLDPEMIPFIVKNKLPYVLMHSRGTPQTMHSFCDYTDLIEDIKTDCISTIDQLKLANVPFIFDPGFGFAKTQAQNFQLLNRLEEFEALNTPILVGISRKSMIWKTLRCNATEALNGTTVLNTIALQKGAKILRVHDVKEAKEAIILVEQLHG
jgi:dihydropteroate synthase